MGNQSSTTENNPFLTFDKREQIQEPCKLAFDRDHTIA